MFERSLGLGLEDTFCGLALGLETCGFGLGLGKRSRLHHWHTPRFTLTTFTGRSFAYVAPSTWNSLPDTLEHTALSLTSFQKQQKTFLLTEH